MGTSPTHHRRVTPGLLAAGLLLASLTGCGDTADPVDADASPEVTATGSAPAGGTDDPTETSAPAGGTDDPTETSPPQEATGTTGTNGNTTADVNCSGTSCSLTLSGDGAQADVLGTPITLGAVQDGRATVRVGDQELSCSQGQTVSAGPLNLECTTVSADTVTMTASLG